MRITWSVPVPGERLSGSRGDVVRAWNLIEALGRQGHDVRVVERAADPGAQAAVSAYRRVARRLLPDEAALALRDAGRWANGRAHARRVAETARAQRADLIVETQVHLAGSGAVAARRAGVPLVLDDCSPASEERALGVGLPRLAQRQFKDQTRAARHLVVSSRALRDRLAGDGVPADKVHVVPNGVDLGAYTRADRDAIRRRLGVGTACLVGFVGSFQPWHRVELLVEALALLTSDHPVRLLLVGDGPERPRVLEEARRLRVDHLVSAPGAVRPDDLPAWVAACDIGALPGSNAYGQPMKLMDYAAAGVPAVAPNLAPVREVVEHGVTGLLFAPGDRPALARALMRLIHEPATRHTLGAAARRFAAGASWESRARDFARVAAGEQEGIACTTCR